MENILYSATGIGFVVLTAIMYFLVLKELKTGLAGTGWDKARQKRIYNKVLFTIAGWSLFISALALSGFLQQFNAFPPRLMIVLVIPLITLLTVTFSKTTSELLQRIAPERIVRLQSFRVGVEILLWLLFIQNVLPIQMSFEGRNFDVLAGLTAPFAAYFLARNRTALAVWNILSLGLLINIITIAILSLPSPFRVFMNEPANTIVTLFPFVLLPGLLVPLAYGLHFLSLRQLALKG